MVNQTAKGLRPEVLLKKDTLAPFCEILRTPFITEHFW